MHELDVFHLLLVLALQLLEALGRGLQLLASGVELLGLLGQVTCEFLVCLHQRVIEVEELGVLALKLATGVLQLLQVLRVLLTIALQPLLRLAQLLLYLVELAELARVDCLRGVEEVQSQGLLFQLVEGLHVLDEGRWGLPSIHYRNSRRNNFNPSRIEIIIGDGEPAVPEEARGVLPEAQ